MARNDRIEVGDSDGATAELEILRGELVRLLVEQTSSTTEYVYDDRITALDEDDDTKPTVGTARNTARRDRLTAADATVTPIAR